MNKYEVWFVYSCLLAFAIVLAMMTSRLVILQMQVNRLERGIDDIVILTEETYGSVWNGELP